MTLLHVQSVHKSYGDIQSLKDVSLKVKKGHSVGIVGESGSGKSTLIKSILGIETIHSGEITFENKSIVNLPSKKRKEFYKHVQVVLQDPSASLNPKLPIWESIIEPYSNYYRSELPFLKKNAVLYKKALQLAVTVGLTEEHLLRYPHELSGGQKQRASIARSMSIQPKLLILDEPTASLDVSIQGQILLLLKKLVKESNLSVLFISHDLAAVQYLCNDIIVMREGEIIEEFDTDSLLHNERHEYTKQLIRYASA